MTDITSLDLLAAAGAGLAAGAINTIAGGGTLVSFPVLLALGVPAVTANVTNTVALCPGYLGGAWAQRHHVQRQRASVFVLVPVCAAGGLLGGVVLLLTPEGAFRAVVPWLILAACALLVVQEPLRRRLARRRARTAASPGPGPGREAAAGAAVLPAAVYGGFFGAGLGVMLMAVLGIVLDDELPAVNAVKSILSLVINVVAALLFVLRADVAWAYAAVLAPASLVGGHLAGHLVDRISAPVLRVVVIAFGVAVSVRMFTA
ncbi:MAG: sulfite exporter TauE/SafE family protein [Acidimicrobiia bacterium]|nr:sulfite exporter TauE/SafE family protein [Acidimicrobiia bacterium]